MVEEEKRFGTIAILKGFVSREHVRRALEIQAKEDLEQKPHRRIGRILVDMGLLDDLQVYQILGALHRARTRK